MKTFQPLILILFSLFSFIHHKTLYAESLVLSNKTLFLGQQEPALSMLVMSRNHKLFYEAYNDVSDLDGDGILDIRYRPSLGSHNDNPNDSSSYNDNYYYGLFDSRLCYHYDGQKFTPRGIANNKRCIGSNDSYWSGDFLNYLTTSRMDAIRKVLYGGKRYEDTSSRTILERAYIPQDGHSWAKEYTSVSVDGYDITDFTPLNQPLSGRRHLFGNLTPATNDPINIPGPPLLRILINSPHRVWEWASIERPVLGNSCNNLQSQRVSCFAEKNTERAEYYVRVEACKSPDSNFVLNPDECKAYPNGNFKPIGQLQKKGETEEQLFGLITGSYDTNLSGGVLRKNISSFADEVDESTGVFTAISGIVKTLDRIRVIDFTSNEFKHDCLDDNLRSPLTETGKCSIWGNPIAEMMYESLRYFAGAASPTPAFSRASSKDNSLQLPKPTWLNPYDEESTGIGHCARANQIVISDIYPNFDTDQLPGVYGWGQSYDSAGVNPGTSTLSSLNVVNEANAITSQEPGITNSERYIGQSQTLYDGAPTGKRVQSLGSVRGLSPEEPTKRGGYYSASIAKFGWEQDISEAKDKQNVKSIAVVLESPVPKIEIPISGKLVTLIPFGKTVGGCIGIQPDGDYQPTNTILDVYVESFSSTSGKFRINFEDVEQGNDHEMDAIVEYIYEVEGNNLRITLNSVYGAGNCVQHIGYVISGTTTDGTYLDVRDVSFSNDDVDYILDTPPGGNYKDGKPLPYFSTREFTADFSSNETATLLKDPLWYAAKWGGYETVTQNNVDRMVWDTNNDTNPDNYFLVTNMLSLPRQLEQAFQSTITDVPAMSSVAFDSTRLTDDTLIYRASFQPQNWHGEILAYNANTAITQDTIQANWTASETLSKQASSNSRNIYTFRPDTQQGIPFTWNSLSSTQQLLMRINPITNSRDAEATGQNRVLYVRGQSSFENFRERKSPLGDIINSTPTYVNQPSELYTDLSYITFRENLLNRRPALYVGANDGMLHGFDAETGQELFAYIPSTLIKKLPLLSATNYAHEYFVDGQLATRDVYINGQWRTYLVGGLRAGGQTFFALDITNPSNYQESNNNAKALVKWEFTDRDDPDLGYTFSTPVITQMNNGKWVAIFGNGYNNTENDDDDIDDEIRTISATGNAVLYIIDLATGELLHKLDTQVGTFQGMANGLASPAAIDANQDGKVDWIYAGDLLGNLWKFDVTSENKEQWSIAGDGPLFQAKHNDQHQPITVRPDVSLHPSLQGFILYFGTGRYFANNDNDSKGQTTQSFYAIWDNIYSNRTTITQDSLLQQNVLQEVSTVITTDNGENISYDFRITSEHPISWYLGAAQAPPANVHLGWFIHLTTPDGTNRGERQVTYPKLRNGRIVFTTLIPTEVSCEAGGEGWLMELDAFSGARLESPAIDINEDGKFNINDTLTIDEISTVISGYKLQGVPSSPAFLNDIDNNSEIKAINLSSGVTETFQESADPFLPGRQSWREIR